jgi:mRNA interferase MazF
MNRGDIWLVDLDPTVGAEMRKLRPAVIVGDESVGLLPLRVIVPITEWKPHFGLTAWMVRLDPTADNGLAKTSAADTFQIRSVAVQRFRRPLGMVSEAAMREITAALTVVLRLRS